MEIKHDICKRCGRKLKTAKSQAEGFGPVCKKKWAEGQKQLEMDLGTATPQNENNRH